MSSGGIAQLVAIGSQDVHLSGNPEITFFQSSYKRHVNFSRVTERQVIQGNPEQDGMSTVKFDRKGDLLNYVYITCSGTPPATYIDDKGVTQPAYPAGSNPAVPQKQCLGIYDWRFMIDHIELYIGGQMIDSQSSEFCELLAIDSFSQNLTMSSAGGHHDGPSHNSEFYPLRFFFNASVTSALPIVALQNQEVEIRIYWYDKWNDMTYSYHNSALQNMKNDSGMALQFDVWANYVFLDDTERQKLVKKPINMLITQVQASAPCNGLVQELNFNHPVKFLMSSEFAPDIPIIDPESNEFASGSNALCNPSVKVKVQINGEDISDFKYTVPHFTNAMSYYHSPFDNGNYTHHFMYPFCIDTSKLQPTGTLNFSRLDSARIIVDSEKITGTIYAVNYNILRIENGMAGLMYAN